MANSEVLVIGGGVIGVCTAYYLAQAGHAVTVLERAEEICPAGASSYGNAGIICPSDIVPLASPGVMDKGLRWMLDDTSPFFARPRLDAGFARWLWLFRGSCREERATASRPVLTALGTASRGLYDELTAGREDEYGFRPTGWVTVCTTEEGLAETVREADEANTLGIASVVLDAEDVRARVPGVTTDALGGVFTPTNAFVDPKRFVRGIAKRAQDLGVAFHTETEVLGFTLSPRRVSAVVTTRGVYACQTVVLAAGVWTRALARSLGQSVEIEPAKGYSLDMKRPATCGASVLYLYEGAVCTTPFDDRIRVAGTLELTGFDMTVNRRRVLGIRRTAERFIPGLAESEPIGLWRGLRPITPDGLPFIGRVPHIDNAIVAAGHCMMGITQGPASGKLVAQLVARETPQIDLRPLRLDRFVRRD
jgi:D-amino-acid dehydrogenase